jgi:hypothetical protein
MYRLPYNYCHHGYHQSWVMLAEGFELNGQMCLAVNVFDEALFSYRIGSSRFGTVQHCSTVVILFLFGNNCSNID